MRQCWMRKSLFMINRTPAILIIRSNRHASYVIKVTNWGGAKILRSERFTGWLVEEYIETAKCESSAWSFEIRPSRQKSQQKSFVLIEPRTFGPNLLLYKFSHTIYSDSFALNNYLG